jgi:hypothetical protein
MSDLTGQVKKARAQTAKPKEHAPVDSEAAVGSEYPVFVWWTVDPKTTDVDSDVHLSSLELMRYSQNTWFGVSPHLFVLVLSHHLRK